MRNKVTTWFSFRVSTEVEDGTRPVLNAEGEAELDEEGTPIVEQVSYLALNFMDDDTTMQRFLFDTSARKGLIELLARGLDEDERKELAKTLNPRKTRKKETSET